MKQTIGFIGAGKMGEALIRALRHESRILVFDKDNTRLEHVCSGLSVEKASLDQLSGADVLFLAVKPQDIDNVLKDLHIANAIIISIAAGITISHIEGIIGKKKIVRVMPNTPCLVQQMAAGYSFNDMLDDKDKAAVKKLLNSAGLAFELPETLLDAVTGLCGSGPAFIAYLIRLFADAGISNGLEPDIAYRLALQTFKGTSLLLDSALSPEQLIESVSSPNGTTVAGLKVLEDSRLKQIIHDTVKAAAKRSEELGR